MKKRNKLLALALALSNLLSMGFTVKAEEADTAIENPKLARSILESNGKYATVGEEGVSYPTGWDVDRRGGDVTQQNMGYVSILDTSEEYPVIMYHDIKDRSTGKLVFESSFLFIDAYKGFSIDLMNQQDGTRAVSFGIDNGWFAYDEGKKGVKRLHKIQDNKQYRYKAIIDLDARTAEVSVDGQLIGTYSFTDAAAKTINYLRIKTPDDQEMTVRFTNMKVTENYLIDEQFYGGFPYDWECISVDDGSVKVSGDHSTNMAFTATLTINDSNIIDNTVVRKVFEKSKGNVYTEFRFLRPEKAVDGMNILIKSDDKVAVKLGLSEGNLVDAEGNVLTNVSNTIWHILGIEADTRTGMAQIRYNGRDLCQIPFTESVDYIDRLEFATSVTGKSDLQIKDVVAYIKYSPEEISEYPSAPVIPEKKDDSIVGMMVCDLWHEGGHVGWDRISAYPDREPYLGWYDDTLTEVADWEAKWLAEHGVDAALKCFYVDGGNYNGGPLEPVDSNSAFNAWFNADYTGYMKYALINCATPAGNDPVGHWRNAIVPLWIEQYFKDPRYLVVDNKPVVYMFSWEWTTILGSVEAVAEEIDYLRQEAIKAGFDGVYIFGNAHHLAQKQTAKAVGLDGCIVYNWGRDTANVKFTINQHELQWEMCKSDDVLDLIPVASKGYDKQAWDGGIRSGYASPEDFEYLLEYLKNDYMERYDEDSPASRFICLANWNEYGEGHFMNPSTLHGFGYLDAVRNVFTNGSEHEDTRPSEKVKERLEGRYADDRKWLVHIPPTESQIPSKVLKGWYFNNPADAAEWKVEKQIDGFKNENGNLVGKTNNMDAGIILVNDIKYNIDNAPYIKVRMKIDSCDEEAEIFFKTEENDRWHQSQSQRVPISSTDGYYDYYFKMSDNSLWNGNLKSIRFDMCRDPEINFAIESIEVLENEQVPIKISINGETQKTKGTIDLTNGVTYVPTWPHQGYQEKLECAVIYDNATQTVSVTHKNADMIFTIGSDIVTINGNEVKLAKPLEMVDGLPNLPIRVLAEAIGAEIAWDGESRKILITTQQEEVVVSDYDISTRVPNQWEFEVPGDLEGWTCSTQFYFSRARVKDGQLQLKSMSVDPNMSRNVDFDSSKYKTIKVRVKNESDSNVMQVFWASSIAGGISAQNCQTVTISKNDEDFVEYTFDMSKHANWKGKITQLRIDPIAAMGPISFDYIRVE